MSSCTCSVLLSLSRSVVLHAIESDKVKDLVIEVLKQLVQHTDNKLDDALVEQLEQALRSKDD